jgi:hypothetical protein
MKLYTGLLAASVLSSHAIATHLSDSLLHRVNDVLKDVSIYSWENGTMAQAHLEWMYPLYSVFTSSGDPFPAPGQISNDDIPSIIELAQITLQNRPPTNTSARGQGTGLLEDGAAADPASLGVAVLMANASTQGGVVNGVSYGQAAEMQTNYLLYGVPRVSRLFWLRIGHSIGERLRRRSGWTMSTDRSALGVKACGITATGRAWRGPEAA